MLKYKSILLKILKHSDMTIPVLKKTALIVFIFIFLSNNLLFAQDAILKNLVISNTEEHLQLFLDVEGAFREDMKKVVQSGVPTTFSFYITLHRVRAFWMDKKIANVNVTHTIKYDNLKNEYSVIRSWENNKTVVTQSFEAATELMSRVENLNVIQLSSLDKGKQYQIRAKAELSKMTLPLYLHYVLFFVSLWDFETDWYTVDFTY